MATDVTNYCLTVSALIEKFDNVIPLSNSCGPFQTQIGIMLKDIDDFNIDWFHTPSSPHRKKRGLLNIVGEISRDLFGTLSQTDALEFISQFEVLTNKGIFHERLLRKHTTLIQSTFNLLRETKTMSEKRDLDLNNQIQALNTSVYSLIKFNKEISL